MKNQRDVGKEKGKEKSDSTRKGIEKKKTEVEGRKGVDKPGGKEIE